MIPTAHRDHIISTGHAQFNMTSGVFDSCKSELATMGVAITLALL